MEVLSCGLKNSYHFIPRHIINIMRCTGRDRKKLSRQFSLLSNASRFIEPLWQTLVTSCLLQETKNMISLKVCLTLPQKADGVGFEPTRRFHVCRFSRPVHSTALPPVRVTRLPESRLPDFRLPDFRPVYKKDSTSLCVRATEITFDARTLLLYSMQTNDNYKGEIRNGWHQQPHERN